jgi:hypothetical protein
MDNVIQFPTKHPDFCSHEELMDRFKFAVAASKKDPKLFKNFSHIWKAVYNRAQTETLKSLAKELMLKTGE